jgi:hypothetical protein
MGIFQHGLVAAMPARSYVNRRNLHATKYAANRDHHASGFRSVTVADGFKRADWCVWYRLMASPPLKTGQFLACCAHGRSLVVSRATINLALLA